MGIQESILRKTANAQRALFNHKIQVVGRQLYLVRIGTKRDMYHDIVEESVIEENKITAALYYPTEFPISRYRVDGDTDIEQTRTHFFEILPIEAYFQFKDKIERDDLLFHIMWDEWGNKVPMVLRVTESLGRFSTDLVWRKYYCAPENMDLEEEVQSILEQKIDEWE